VFLAEVSLRHANEFILTGRAPSQTSASARQRAARIATALQSTTQSGGAGLGEGAGEMFVNRLSPHMDALEAQLVSALAMLENDAARVASLCGFEWIKSVSLKAN
jgi:hypothetical protein